MADETEKLIAAFAQSLVADTFVKMTLGNYKGSVEHPQKIVVRPVAAGRGKLIAFQYRYDTREIVKNQNAAESSETVRTFVTSGFRSAHLFTTENDFQLDIGKRSSRLRVCKPTFTHPGSVAHDRKKERLIDPGAYYLKALGITTDGGDIRSSQQDKWRQINKFVETLGHLIEGSALKDRKSLKVVDMGSGKGYLTFAAYDYFTNTRGLEVEMTGIDTKSETVALCTDIAAACSFDNLKFVNGTIADHAPDGVDLLIALHACDTATDDALFSGIRAGAEIIVAAPCCHKEVRRQMKPPAGMHNFLKHGILLERTAETVTDGLRSLLLERSGYNTKVFEFIDPENTPKNNMIAAIKAEKPRERGPFDNEIVTVKNMYGITHQRLEDLLA
ncbi:MAG: SAM-dependent methyltransferase [Acidobacteriota bacterium]